MKYKAYTIRNFRTIPQMKAIPEATKKEMEIVARVLPFKSNSYVVEQLINWDNYKYDPIFKLTFPVREMLSTAHFSEIEHAVNAGLPEEETRTLCNRIRMELNPHPAGQMGLNIPTLDGEKLEGIQHKYKETVLFFPSQGQTCHAYCTFCFRWPQFSGLEGMKISAKEATNLARYLKEQKKVTNVLFTGGDPLVMKTKVLVQYINKLLKPEFDHIHTIRIGSKALSYWPYRFTTDKDAGELLDLFKKVSDSGKQIALMAHFNHPVELSTEAVQEAIKLVRDSGAKIRTQSPIMKNINDSGGVWTEMWRLQASLGCIPYYMFMARDTGAKEYFGISIEKAYEIFRQAYSEVSGVARTARGPVMSSAPGKAHIVGISEVNGEKIFVLQFLQARNPEWVKRPFFAKYDSEASWLTDLEPAFGEEKFFWQEEFETTTNLSLKSADYQEEE